ncbi:hypothetical protein C8Q79DRAFT_1011824 [Trametes meyenii]|nr:hypothetical protein C8Q79DRAFT_1011824 [Trametes meyenii]
MPASRSTKSSRTATKKAKAQQVVNWYEDASESQTVVSQKPGKICPVCGISLAGDLARHMKLHKEPEFQCPYEGCNHRSRQRSNLQAHFNTHTGNRPAKCPEVWLDEHGVLTTCVACFRDGSSLTRHRQRYHGYDSRAKRCPGPFFRSVADQIDDKLTYHLCLTERLAVVDAEKKLLRLKAKTALPKELLDVAQEWYDEHGDMPPPNAPYFAGAASSSSSASAAAYVASSSSASASTHVASASASVASSSGWSSSSPSSPSPSPSSSPAFTFSALPSSSTFPYAYEKVLSNMSAAALHARLGSPFSDFLLPYALPEPQSQPQPQPSFEEVEYPPVRPAAPFPGCMRQPQPQQPQAFVDTVAQQDMLAPSQVPIQFDDVPKIEFPGGFDFGPDLGFDFDFAAQPAPAPAPTPAPNPVSLFGLDGQWSFDTNTDFELFGGNVDAGFFGFDLGLGLGLGDATTSGGAEAGSPESLTMELPPLGGMPAPSPVPQPQLQEQQTLLKEFTLPTWTAFYGPQSPSSSASTAPSSPSANEIDELAAFY